MVSTLQNFGVPLNGGTRTANLMPKMKSKFRVIATNFGVPTGSIALTGQTQTITRPTVTSDAVEIQSYMSRSYYAGKPTYSTITLVVRDDVTNAVSSLVGAQIQKQMNHYLQTSPLSADSYKFQLLIDTLDGGGTANADAIVLEEWFLEGCFLINVNYEQFDFTSSDAMTISMEIRYDNATSGQYPTTPTLSPANGFID